MLGVILLSSLSLCLFAQSAAAQRVLLSVPAGGTPPAAVRHGGQELPLRTSPARLEDAPSVVVLADWLEEEERKELAAYLKKRLAQTRDRERVALVVVRGLEPIPLPPLRTAAQLERELSLALEPEAGGGARPSAEQLYDLLLGMAPEGGEAWREWIWAGRLPVFEDPLAQEYLRGRLQQTLGSARLRLTVWPEPPQWIPAAEEARGSRLYEAEWEAPPAGEGFEIVRVKLEDAEWPWVAAAPGFRLPGIATLMQFLHTVRAAADSSAGEKELAALQRGMDVFPNHLPALEAGAALGERLGDFRGAAFFLERLTARRPAEAALWRRYAAAAWRARLPEAERALRRALEALPRDAELLEWLGRARIAAGDNREAYGLIRQSLEERADNTTLWWIAADLARELGDEFGERTALRQALDREPGRADRRARLVALSRKAGDGPVLQRTLEEAEAQGGEEKDIGILEQYAEGWEALGDSGRALRLWSRTIELDARYEKGHLSVCRLLEARKDWPRTLEAAERGLAGVPESAGLHLVRARALWNTGRQQDARRALREAAAAVKDVRVAEARAETEDLFGGEGALEAWRELLAQLDAAGAETARKEQARRRALRAALRDGHPEAASRYLELPHAPADAVQGESGKGGLLIPGGVQVLRFLSGIGGPDDAGEYLSAFARAVVQRSLFLKEKEWERYSEPLLEHYERLAQLRKPFPAARGGTEIVLSAESQKQRQQTQRVLELLGYRLRTGRGRLSIEMQTKGERAKRHTLAAALDLDDRAVEEALAGGKAYTLRIRDELARPVLGEKAWADVLRRHQNPLGFAGALLREPRLAQVYAGLASAGPAAAEALAARIGIRRLLDDYGMLLFLYGPAMTLDERGRCPVPGGEAAEAAWATLAGEHPRDGAKFLEALLRKDDGMVLAFFAMLHGVTFERQRWFLQSAERARTFYRLMKDAPEWEGRADRLVRGSSILALFRELPLNEDGSVRFPGGPQVWQVARGTSDLDRIQRLERRARRARPAEEEEILERMARERYSANRERFSQLDNFLMVARIEQALGRELEPREALILSQQFARYEWAYPMLIPLPGLGEKEFLAFFAWAEALDGLSSTEKNLSIGLVSHVALLEGLLVRAGRLDGKAAAEILAELCAGMKGVQDFARMAEAARNALRRLAAALEAKPGGLGSALEAALFGPEETPAGSRRRSEFRGVLAAQKIPPLDAVLEALDAAGRAGTDAGAAQASAAALERVAAQLEVLPMPKTMKPPAALKELLSLWRTRELAEIARELRQKAARKKPNPKDLQKLGADARRELAPWLELSLRGLTAGFYLRPSDLPVSEDPWLLRKYWYADTSQSARGSFPYPEFRIDSAGPGSLMLGSPGGLPLVAAEIAVAGQKAALGFAGAVEVKQIASLRNTLWLRLREQDLRAARLAWLAGREWVLDAAFDADAAAGLERAATGLLAPERLAAAERLLRRLRNLHSLMPAARPFRSEYESLWRSVWECFSMSDLFWLGRQRRDAPAEAVAAKALAALPAGVWAGPAEELGPLRLEMARSAAPQLAPMPPYEHFAQELLPGPLGERLSEFSLALAAAADEAGLPPEALALIAEPLARRLLERLEMTDQADFRAAVELWKSITAQDVLRAWQEQMEKAP
ncbi:MAG: hypothetical protein NZR01_10730 [Bryobacteraceae bacterium]|nr:hypothetical protein [Bryobacteraceae bacterium]